MKASARYQHIVLDLTGIRNTPLLLISRFKEALEKADPPIDAEEIRRILMRATALDKEHLLETIYSTVQVLDEEEHE